MFHSDLAIHDLAQTLYHNYILSLLALPTMMFGSAYTAQDLDYYGIAHVKPYCERDDWATFPHEVMHAQQYKHGSVLSR